MRTRTTNYARILSTLVAAALGTAVGGAGCGGSTTSPGGDGGSSSSGGSGSGSGSGGSSGSGSSGASGSGSSSGMACGGCCNPQSATLTVDPTKCEPQLSGTYSCDGGKTVCSWTVEIPCAGDAGILDAGADGGLACVAWCNAAKPQGVPDSVSCASLPLDGGDGVTAYCGACASGRPPRGFAARPAGAPDAAGETLARIAQLEAASVEAFHALRADLATLGAPRGLLGAVRGAARDEVRHARVMKRAAERYGARVPETIVPAARPRSLLQLAIENAEEGCVRETFGAAVAALQAARATDARLRRSMRRIAEDELGHAALAWRIAAWLEGELDARGRASVARARRAAVARLRAELAAASPGSAALGLPDSRGASAAFASMSGALDQGLQARAKCAFLRPSARPREQNPRSRRKVVISSSKSVNSFVPRHSD